MEYALIGTREKYILGICFAGAWLVPGLLEGGALVTQGGGGVARGLDRGPSPPDFQRLRNGQGPSPWIYKNMKIM